MLSLIREEVDAEEAPCRRCADDVFDSANCGRCRFEFLLAKRADQEMGAENESDNGDPSR